MVPSEPENAGAPPYPLVDNTHCPLDVCDLVFIDPVGTGFSRALGNHNNKEHWGVKEDARSIADFIQVWITQHKRWNSPKYLVGESYGTVRAAMLADALSERYIGIEPFFSSKGGHTGLLDRS